MKDHDRKFWNAVRWSAEARLLRIEVMVALIGVGVGWLIFGN